jgi:hypothetical protein
MTRHLFAEMDEVPEHCRATHIAPTPTGEDLKKAGMSRAAKAASVELQHARATARAIAENRGTVTADDVIKAIGKSLGNAAGSLFTGGDFEWTGEYRKSERKEAHSNRLMVWKLKNA